MKIKKIESQQTHSCCYIVENNNKECIIIDPGFNDKKEIDFLLEYISDNALKPIKIILTHWHYDHVIGVNKILERYNIPVFIHKDDYNLLKLTNIVSMFFGIKAKNPKGTIVKLKDDDEIVFGEILLKTIHTPGHSKGSICLYDKKDNICFTGDTLFSGSIGRTDFPDSSIKKMKKSLKILISLPANCKIYPGHGEESTIEEEINTNPFIQQIN